MISGKRAYGEGRNRGATVSYGEIERAARDIMDSGGRPTVEGVYKALGRGSPNHISSAMQTFWKNQSALNGGDPLALTRLPPELADAAVAQWEQALRLAHQNATYDDNAARAHLEQLRRDTDARARSVELREKEWDLAARVRERALADTRDQVNLLMKELAIDRTELRFRDARIADLETHIEAYRQQLARVVARAVARNRASKSKKPAPRSPRRSASKTRIRAKKRSQSKRPKLRTRR
jgi:Plasmid replication region DNA-binding N-term